MLHLIPIFDLFSKRLKGEIPEILTYDEILKTLRGKVDLVLKEMLGEDAYGDNNKIN